MLLLLTDIILVLYSSEVFEAVSFARKDVSQPSQVVLTCDVEYCTASNDTECFVSIDINLLLPPT